MRVPAGTRSWRELVVDDIDVGLPVGIELGLPAVRCRDVDRDLDRVEQRPGQDGGQDADQLAKGLTAVLGLNRTSSLPYPSAPTSRNRHQSRGRWNRTGDPILTLRTAAYL